MKIKEPTILFFIDGGSPTIDEKILAFQTPGKVSFINSRRIPKTGSIPKCDGVMGTEIPERYKDHPTAKEATDSYIAALRGEKEKPKPAAPKSAPSKPAEPVKAEAKTEGNLAGWTANTTESE